MKDTKDTKTGELFTSRQAKYRQKLQAAGLRQHAFWLTPEEAEKVRQLIEKLREGK